MGLSCVNALSEWVDVDIHRNSRRYTQNFVVESLNQMELWKKEEITMEPKSIFFQTLRIFRQDLDFDPKIISWRLEELSYLHPTCSFLLSVEEKDGWTQICYEHPDGISEYVIQKSQARRPVYPKPLYVDVQSDDKKLWSLQIESSVDQLYSQELKTYVKFHRDVARWCTFGCGVGCAQKYHPKFCDISSNLSRFEDAILETRDITEGLTGMLSVLVSDPEFAGQTKDKLTNGFV